MKLSKKFKVKIKFRVLMILSIVTVLSSILVVDKIANGQESMIGQIESYMDEEEAVEIASVYDSSLISEEDTTTSAKDRLENTDTITYIYDANDLAAFRDSVNSGNDYAGKTVYVMDDIDMSSVCSETIESWVPIGVTGTNFAGTFNGNYHSINNLYINSSDYSWQGLFYGVAKNGTIQNIVMKNVSILNTYENISHGARTGGIAGLNYGKILNCGIENGNIIARRTMVNTVVNTWPPAHSGGIAGLNGNTGTISGCYNKAKIESYAPQKNYNEIYAGGIVGINLHNIENCYNTGYITGNSYNEMIGGIVGGAELTGERIGYVKNCYNYGTITSGTGTYKYAGGVVGRSGWCSTNYNLPVTNCFTTNNITYSYYYWNGSAITISTVGKTKPETLKTYATTLGYAFSDDSININNGYPVLKWELPRYRIIENQEYIKIGKNSPLTLERIMFREGFEDNLEDVQWSSSNEEVATVDSNGIVTGKGIGHTTITAYNLTKGLKAKAVINVYRNQEGSITVPQVEIGEDYTTVLKEDGTVWATGKNDVGQLGDGTTTNRNTLAQVKIDENTYLTNVKKIASSVQGSIALTQDGEVYAWGRNNLGQLGQGNTNDLLYAAKVKGKNGLGYIQNVIDVSFRDYESYLLDEDGDVYGIGYNKLAQIDDDINTNKTYPTLVGFEEIIQITSGYSNVAVINSKGEVYIKGDNRYGVFGNNKTISTGGGLYRIGTDINEIRLAGYIGVILKEDGSLWISGRNDVGQLGLGDTTDRSIYTQVNYENGEAVKPKAISVGSKNLQFIGKDGKVYVAGHNEKGQLSNGATANVNYPIAIKNADGTEVTDCILLATGINTYYENQPKNMGIIRQDGSVWIAGDNTYGQMGNSTNESSSYITKMGGEDTFHYQNNEIELDANETYQIDTQKLSYKNNAFNVFKKEDYKVGDDLTYTSLNDNIATVNGNGEITAKEVTGNTKIKVEDTTNGFTTYITVNVKNRLQNTDTTTYIYDANDLVAFRDSVNSGNDYAGKTVYIMADIDMSSVCSETIGSFTPIGATEVYFAGIFHGNYHTISNLYMKDSRYNKLGLFSRTSDTSVIRNLIMEDVYIYNEYDTVDNSTFAGGIVGIHRGEIINCGINSGTITGIKTTAYTGTNYVGTEIGGIVGCGYGKIDSCYNKANIKVKASTKNYPNEGFAGGIIGVLEKGASIQNCYNTGNIEAEGYQGFAGGIIASANKNGDKQSVKNCYSIGATKATGNEAAYAGGIIGRTGWSSTYPAITMNNIYCATNNTYSYYYWNGSKVASSTNGKTELETLKTYATTLGYAFNDDTININNEYPVLKWELPRYKIVENQEYIKIGQSMPLTLERIMVGEDFEDNTEDIEWSSSNKEVATVDSDGVVAGKGIGHTTITAYNPKNGIKTRAIINVYRNQEGAITIPQIVEQESSTIVLKEDGTVWTSGLNDKGQLGDGTTENRNTLVQVKINEDTYLTNVIKLTAGDHEGTVALTKNGEVYGWGSNAYGNLATGNQEKQVYAHKMEINSNDKIIDVSNGNIMTHVLTEDGNVYYVGTCLFDGYNYNNENTTTYTFKEMAELEDIIKLESHGSWYGTYMAMKSDGSTLGWGYDRWGQLGQGSTIMTRELTQVGTDIVDIEVGDYASIIQREDGEFYITGDNRYGGLGIGASGNINNFQKLSLSNDENGNTRKIVKARRQGYNTVVLASDGTVWASGLNAVGQLSQGNTTNTSTFMQLKNSETEYLEKAIDISSGEVFGDSATRSANIGVIKEDGSVWIAGDNTYGQMGNRNNQSFSYLVKMGDAFLKYPEETITLNVGSYKKIEKLLIERQDAFNVFVKEATIPGDLIYEVEDEEIASITNLGMIEGKKQGKTKVKVTDSNTKASTYIEIEVVDINLSSVTVNDVELQPEETDKYTYKMNIKKLDTKAKVKIVTEYPETTITIRGHEKEIGESEQWVDLSLEEDVIEIPVIVSLKNEERTSTVMYKIVLTRQSNDTSAVVSYDEVELTKAEDEKYKVNVLDTAISGKIKVVTTHEKAKVDIGNTTQYEENSKEYTVLIDSNTAQKTIEVPITVMAEDGTIENSTVVITIIATNTNTAKIEGTFEAEEKEITKQATIDEQGNYLIGVKQTTKEIELKITTESQYATITTGTELGKGELITKVTLENDITYVNYEVTAEDGKTEVQKTIKIVKQSSDARIKNIVVEGKEVTIDEEGIYHASVEGGSTGAKVIITANSNVATVGISGIANPNTNQAILNTAVGINTIQNTYTITVTAEDGTVKIYTLKITRQTNIVGKIITENIEGNHKSLVTVYKTNDKKPETKPLNDETTEIRKVIARQETKEDGTFIIEVEDIEPYDVLVTKLGYLDYRITEIEVEEGEKTELNEYKLMAGDVVKSGQIEIDDLVALNDNFGLVITDANREQKAIYDLNEDGKVDDLDREILRKNYGKKNKLEQWEDPKRIRRMRTRRVETLPENPQNFILPIKGKYQITSDYGARTHPITGEVKKHTGIDLGGEHRTEIYAVADGEVVFAGVQNAFGNCIEIKHEIDGEIIYSFYAHLSRIDVKVGQEIKQEEVIGLEGGDPNTDPNPGSSTGHHLHFELRSKSGYGNDVNPRKYIEF